MHVYDAEVEPDVLWDYMVKDGTTLSDMVKSTMGIGADTEVFFGVYAEYLINPKTGEICRSDDGPGREEFVANVRNRRSALLAEYGYDISTVS